MMGELERLLDEEEQLLPDHQEIIRNWDQDTTSLFGQLEAWLHDFRLKGKVLIDYDFEELNEQELGPYKVQMRRFRFRGVPGPIDVRPRSPLVVGVRLPDGGWESGTQGRVDLSRGAIRLPLVRTATSPIHWKVGIGNQLVDLTEQSFERALKVLLGFDSP